MTGEIELNENYFDRVRKGKRRREAGVKTPAFGLLKRNDKIHAFPTPNVRTETLLPIIRRSIKPDLQSIPTA